MGTQEFWAKIIEAMPPQQKQELRKTCAEALKAYVELVKAMAKAEGITAKQLLLELGKKRTKASGKRRRRHAAITSPSGNFYKTNPFC